MKRKVSVVLMLLCVCMVYLFSAYVLTPASESDRESLVTKYKTLQQYETAVRGAPTTEEKIRALSADTKTFEDRFITEKSAFLASAKIQGEITDLAGKTNLNVSTIRPLAAAKLKDYNVSATEKADLPAASKIQREVTDRADKTNRSVSTIPSPAAVKLNEYDVIPVYFEGSGNIKQLSNFLKLVESGKLLLKIDKLSVNITNMQKTDDLKFKIQIAGLNRI